MSELRRLFIEQTTPSEVVLFLFTVTVGCLALAAFVYAVGMTSMWLMWLRRRDISLGQIFLPSKRILSENLAEYVLAAGTALSLTFAIVGRHDVVDQVRGAMMSEVEEVSAVGAVFPLQVLPDSLTSVVNGMTLEGFLSPVLQTATPSATVSLVRAAMSDAGLAPPQTGWLLVVIALLATGHLTYLAWQRSSKLIARPGAAGNPGYVPVGRKLLVLAVSVALLLVARVQYADAGNLAESAGAVMRAASEAEGEGGDPGTARVREAVQAQLLDLSVLQNLHDGDGRGGSFFDALAAKVGRLGGDQERSAARLDAEIVDVRAHLEGIRGELGALDARSEERLDALGSALDERIRNLEGEQERQARRLASVEADVATASDQARRAMDMAAALRSLHADEGELIVLGARTGAVQVLQGQTVVARGSLPLTATLRPGRYDLVYAAAVTPPTGGSAPLGGANLSSGRDDVQALPTPVANLSILAPRADTLRLVVRADRLTSVTLP